jgi:hypothetical protein
MTNALPTEREKLPGLLFYGRLSPLSDYTNDRQFMGIDSGAIDPLWPIRFGDVVKRGKILLQTADAQAFGKLKWREV